MLVTELANYVLILDEAAAASKKADDRPLYGKYRGHAGVLLALAVLDDRHFGE